MKAAPAPDLLVLRHPVTGGIGLQTRKQFVDLYEQRGWEIAPDVDMAHITAVTGVKVTRLADLDPAQIAKVLSSWNARPDQDRRSDLMDLLKDELVEKAEALGLPSEGTKSEVADRIVAAEANVEQRDPG